MKTSELIGLPLDLAVGLAMGRKPNDFGWWWDNFKPSTNWAQGGPIIGQESIEIRKGNPLYFPQGNDLGDYYEPLWLAGKQHGPTPLVAAMRCYVASVLGDEVEIPEELT